MADPYRFRLNRRGVRDLLDSPGVRVDLNRRAERVRAAAVATSPRSEGRLAASHRVESDTTPGGRARARVVAETPYAAVLAASGRNWLAAALEAARG